MNAIQLANRVIVKAKNREAVVGFKDSKLGFVVIDDIEVEDNHIILKTKDTDSNKD